jgi:hypothetical protein
MNHKTRNLLSKGFSAGNYASAYVSENYVKAFEADNGPKEHDAYCTAFVLGFFGSYEVHEIPADCQDMFQSAYFSENGQAVISAGYVDSRPESDWRC